MKDLDLLRACLASGRLEMNTADAFGDMAWELETGKYDRLTPRQRNWLLAVAGALDLVDSEPENLISSGKIKPTEEEKRGVDELLKSLGPKPLKPPGKAGR